MPGRVDALPPPIPAATLVAIRDRLDGAPELLIVERSDRLAFAAGALVFPGGRVDPGDRDLAASLGRDDDDGAARVAAVRETLEETGLAVAIRPEPDETVELALRKGLNTGRLLADLLGEAGLRLELERLTPFARWLPNFRETRRFDARFYLASAPADSRLPVPDEGESVHAAWMTAADALRRADRGEAGMLFPTRRNLERLARYAGFAQAVEDAMRHPPRVITPWIEDRDGQSHVVIPDDLGYPVTSEPLATARRA